MKLLMAIVDEDDADELIEALVDSGLGVTKVAGTGGLLRRGNATLLAAITDEAVDEAVGVVRRKCQRREIVVDAAFDVKGTVGGALISVLDIEQSAKI